MLMNAVHLIKLGDLGLLTLELPQMAGKYMVVEQVEGKLVITPMDLEGKPRSGIIARQGRKLTLIGGVTDEVPMV